MASWLRFRAALTADTVFSMIPHGAHGTRHVKRENNWPGDYFALDGDGGVVHCAHTELMKGIDR